MRRKRVESTPILETWDDVDRALLRIGRINIEVEKAQNYLMNLIDLGKEEAKKMIEGLPDEKADLEKQIADFCQFHRDQFKKKKSKELPFGFVGFRMSVPKLTTLKGWTWDKVVGKLREMRKRGFLKYRDPIPDKEAIKNSGLSAKELADFGVAVEQKEEFFYDIKTEEIQTPRMELLQKEE